MMTMQEIFDNAVGPLLRQGYQSATAGGTCKLRDGYGSKCAVGWLIPDERYEAWMEDASYLGTYPPDPEFLMELNEDVGLAEGPRRHDLLRALQYVHDAYPDASEWPKAFRDVAQEFNLSSAVIDAWEA